MLLAPSITSSEMTAMWERMLVHRSEINQCEVTFSLKMGLGNNDQYLNPFNDAVRKYDDVLLELQCKLVERMVSAYRQTFAPNVEIDSDHVLRTMIEALTDGETPTTVYGKPLCFSAYWVAQYLQENYLKPDVAREKAYEQILRTVRSKMLSPRFHEINAETIREGEVLTFPFYVRETWNDTYDLHGATVDFMNALDKFIQVILREQNPVDVKSQLFTPIMHHWWRENPKSNEIFKTHSVTTAYSPVETIRVFKGRAEIEIRFKHESDAKLVASRIFEPTHT